MSVQIQMDGLDRIIAKLGAQLVATPLRRFWTRSALAVQGKARRTAPSDRGHLRNALMYEVDPANLPMWAKVGLLGAGPGSPIWSKARAMEYGTGRRGDPAVPHTSGHFPPPAALEVWAKRHHIEGGGWAVAKAIARKGGLKPRPFLRPALLNSLGDIHRYGQTLLREIRAAWDSRQKGA